MDLKELIKEINYQEAYSYEKRIDLFNKYRIPTHLNFFNPIYELGKFIVDKRGYYKSNISDYESFNDGRFSAYSHSGNISSDFNAEFKVEAKENKSKHVKIYNDGSIQLYGYDKDVTTENKYRAFIVFNSDKTFTVRYANLSHTVKIPRNIYDLIDEWLIDFGYEKW